MAAILGMNNNKKSTSFLQLTDLDFNYLYLKTVFLNQKTRFVVLVLLSNC
jgi:hypothetical protein